MVSPPVVAAYRSVASCSTDFKTECGWDRHPQQALRQGRGGVGARYANVTSPMAAIGISRAWGPGRDATSLRWELS
uniref:Uncharacterized protein n=1 Tax=Oryza rufipogon TaxID=4529 RepID=A0A0E0P4F5_ORYRU